MITENENRLFSEWQQKVLQNSNAIFVTDGITNEDAWNAAPVKVLYLLKEVNGAEERWDERDYLRNYNKNAEYVATHSQTINNLIRWQYGLSKLELPIWPDVESAVANEEIQSKLLSEICLVNLKKTAGGGLVDWNKFDAYWNLEQNRDFVKKQLDFYLVNEHNHANYMVCGGTAYYLSQLYNIKNSDWNETSRGVRYTLLHHTVCLDFCHPNNRGPKNLVFYGLLDALKEIQGKNI